MKNGQKTCSIKKRALKRQRQQNLRIRIKNLAINGHQPLKKAALIPIYFNPSFKQQINNYKEKEDQKKILSISMPLVCSEISQILSMYENKQKFIFIFSSTSLKS